MTWGWHPRLRAVAASRLEDGGTDDLGLAPQAKGGRRFAAWRPTLQAWPQSHSPTCLDAAKPMARRCSRPSNAPQIERPRLEGVAKTHHPPPYRQPAPDPLPQQGESRPRRPGPRWNFRPSPQCHSDSGQSLSISRVRFGVPASACRAGACPPPGPTSRRATELQHVARHLRCKPVGNVLHGSGGQAPALQRQDGGLPWFPVQIPCTSPNRSALAIPDKRHRNGVCPSPRSGTRGRAESGVGRRPPGSHRFRVALAKLHV